MSSTLNVNLRGLKDRLKGKILVLGIGNTLRADDGAGSILAKRIKGKVPFKVIDGGASPENFLLKIAKERPDTILIIDAVDFGGLPGEIKIFNHKLKEAKFYSTHNLPLNLLMNYLLRESVKDIMILGLQPKDIRFKRRLSKEMSSVLENLEREFLGILKN